MSTTLEAVGGTSFPHRNLVYLFLDYLTKIWIFKIRPTYRRLTRTLKNYLEAMWKEAVEE